MRLTGDLCSLYLLNGIFFYESASDVCTLLQGSSIILAEGSEGCQLVRADASLNLIGAYKGSSRSPTK